MTALSGTGTASSSAGLVEPARTAERPRRIVVVAPLRYPIAEPHAGGLE